MLWVLRAVDAPQRRTTNPLLACYQMVEWMGARYQGRDGRSPVGMLEGIGCPFEHHALCQQPQEPTFTEGRRVPLEMVAVQLVDIDVYHKPGHRLDTWCALCLCLK